MAEQSGRIFLMDRLLAIEGVILEKYSPVAIKEIIDNILNDFYRVHVTLEIESSHLKHVKYSCPYCNTENVLLKKEEMELKKKYSDFITIFSIDENGKINENENESRILNQYSNAHGNENGNQKRLSDNSYDREDLERTLLSYCTSCQLPSSTINFFENRIFN